MTAMPMPKSARAAREALLALSVCLRALSDHTGELRIDARRVWLHSRSQLANFAEIDRILDAVNVALTYVYNYSEMARPPRSHEPNSVRWERYAGAADTVSEHFDRGLVGRSAAERESAANVRAALMAEARRLLGIERSVADAKLEETTRLLTATQNAAERAVDALCALVDEIQAASC